MYCRQKFTIHQIFCENQQLSSSHFVPRLLNKKKHFNSEGVPSFIAPDTHRHFVIHKRLLLRFIIMDQFADTGMVVDRGSCSINDDGSGESKWKGELDSLVVGKKRPPSTFHPETFNSTKKRSQENYRGSENGQSCAQSRMYNTSHDIDSVRRSYAKRVFWVQFFRLTDSRKTRTAIGK